MYQTPDYIGVLQQMRYNINNGKLEFGGRQFPCFTIIIITHMYIGDYSVGRI